MTQVAINGQPVTVVEYAGQRVVTFKVIDVLHERPEGTARKRFNDNKRHFIEGTDYWEISQPSEIRTLGLARENGGTAAKVIIISDTGYAMLAKSFTDDLAWNIQRELVQSYFGGKSASAKKPRIRKPSVTAIFKSRFAIARLIGLDDNQSAIAAGRACEKKCGENPLPDMGLIYLEAPTQQRTMTATQVAEALKLPGKKLGESGNNLMEAAGLQTGDKNRSWCQNSVNIIIRPHSMTREILFYLMTLPCFPTNTAEKFASV